MSVPLDTVIKLHDGTILKLTPSDIGLNPNIHRHRPDGTFEKFGVRATRNEMDLIELVIELSREIYDYRSQM